MGTRSAHIFVGYRRRDSQGFAGHLADDLIEHFGADRVFRDDDIPEGSDFTQVLDAALSSCRVLIVVIGPQWVHARDASGQQRLWNRADWVRREIEAALERDIWIQPVLVSNASMPTPDELPPELSALTRIQAFEMSDRGWEDDLDRLTTLLSERIPALASPRDVARTAGTAADLHRVFADALSRASRQRASVPAASTRYLRRIRASVIRLAWLTLLALVVWYLFENRATPEFRQEVAEFIDFVRKKFIMMIETVKRWLELR